MLNRIRDIIKILLNGSGFVTMKDLADKIGVSERTIYRDMPEVVDILAAHNIKLTTYGKHGLKLSGNADELKNLLQTLQDDKKVLITNAQERLDYILLCLLSEQDFLKTEAIAIDTAIPLPTVRKIKKKIESTLSIAGLTLAKKKGVGIRIHGDAMKKIICSQICSYVTSRKVYYTVGLKRIRPTEIPSLSLATTYVVSLSVATKIFVRCFLTLTRIWRLSSTKSICVFCY